MATKSSLCRELGKRKLFDLHSRGHFDIAFILHQLDLRTSPRKILKSPNISLQSPTFSSSTLAQDTFIFRTDLNILLYWHKSRQPYIKDIFYFQTKLLTSRPRSLPLHQNKNSFSIEPRSLRQTRLQLPSHLQSPTRSTSKARYLGLECQQEPCSPLLPTHYRKR